MIFSYVSQSLTIIHVHHPIISYHTQKMSIDTYSKIEYNQFECMHTLHKVINFVPEIMDVERRRS